MIYILLQRYNILGIAYYNTHYEQFISKNNWTCASAISRYQSTTSRIHLKSFQRNTRVKIDYVILLYVRSLKDCQSSQIVTQELWNIRLNMLMIILVSTIVQLLYQALIRYELFNNFTLRNCFQFRQRRDNCLNILYGCTVPIMLLVLVLTLVRSKPCLNTFAFCPSVVFVVCEQLLVVEKYVLILLVLRVGKSLCLFFMRVSHI